MGKLKKKRILSFILCLFTAFCALTSCSHEKESFVRQNIVRRVYDDGWVYTMTYTHDSDGNDIDSVPPIVFNAINFRYRYPADFTTDEENPGRIQILGHGISPESDEDIKNIAAFFGYGENITHYPGTDEILAKDRNQLQLKAIDREVFFRMLDEALKSDARKNGKYIDYPSFALLSEPGFKDGYSVQIGHCLGMGNIDVIMIDILYKDDNSPMGYTQLYDLIKNGTATPDQKLLYEYISGLEESIVKNNNFKAKPDNADKELSKRPEIKRIEKFLSDIDQNNISGYFM